MRTSGPGRLPRGPGRRTLPLPALHHSVAAGADHARLGRLADSPACTRSAGRLTGHTWPGRPKHPQKIDQAAPTGSRTRPSPPTRAPGVYLTALPPQQTMPKPAGKREESAGYRNAVLRELRDHAEQRPGRADRQCTSRLSLPKRRSCPIRGAPFLEGKRPSRRSYPPLHSMASNSLSRASCGQPSGQPSQTY